MALKNNQELELEFTYLAKRIPAEIVGVMPTRIYDVYIPEEADHSCLRLRQKGDNYVITKKVTVAGDDSSRMIETTISLTRDEFDALTKCSKKSVCKDRYRVEIAGRMAEVDVFREALEGLVLVDFEFESVEAQEAFGMPEVALADVTQEIAFAGGFLSGRSYNDLLPVLKKYGYEKL